MKRKPIDDRPKVERRKQGFVSAESVIGIRNPDYDKDNIRYETLRQFPSLLRDIRAGNYILGYR